MTDTGGACTLTTWIDARPDAVSGLRHRIDHWLDDRGVRADRRQDIVLSADEAITNAIEHGCPATDRVDIALHLTADTITFTVTSTGAWKWPDADTGRTHGWGLHLIDTCADHVDIKQVHDTVVLTARFARNPAPAMPSTTTEARPVADLDPGR
ncbi:ATP-binding protein [Actinokineospora xionganensis]|uniref:ATP-binding protein n=1 Tax=Actinokineospora xionganensis TaxID=2684470 RepID=A0ABR7KZY2_9PSEU|nr:ATP-binding protein [Actinokineospora xionganensis]MBC6445990.1 ATP-binding protein [Actinokineospora xionganensis]